VTNVGTLPCDSFAIQTNRHRRATSCSGVLGEMPHSTDGSPAATRDSAQTFAGPASKINGSGKGKMHVLDLVVMRDTVSGFRYPKAEARWIADRLKVEVLGLQSGQLASGATADICL
jgi:hypothetical protein